VSPGLVQHYFRSKAELRATVDAHVTEIIREALPVQRIEGDVIGELSERLTRLVADHFVALKYLARGVAENDEAALAVFDTLTQVCRDQLATLEPEGILRDDLDLEWAALHTIVVNLGTVLLEPGVSRLLGRPFLDERQVLRWKDATTKLFVRGEFTR
jgi:AcrR family transcriptional regulator